MDKAKIREELRKAKHLLEKRGYDYSATAAINEALASLDEPEPRHKCDFCAYDNPNCADPKPGDKCYEPSPKEVPMVMLEEAAEATHDDLLLQELRELAARYGYRVVE